MASKFMRIRKIVLPIITVVLLASQLSGCAFMKSTELMEMLESGQSISIEVAAPSTYEIISEVGARQQSIDWVQLDQLSTFSEFRIGMDKVLNVERRTFNGTNTKIGCIYIDAEGDTNGNVTLQDAIRNKVFMEKYYDNGDTKTAIKKLAAEVYTDVNGEDYHSFIAAFNAYYNLIPDHVNPDAFNATQSMTREKFASGLYRATTPVSQDYLVGFGGESDEFTLQMGALTDHTAMVKQMDKYSFINAANMSLDHSNVGNSITRAEAVYMVVNSQFADQLAEVTGKEKVSYTDAKNAGDLALKLGFKVKNKEAKTVESRERWESYTLYSMLQNPDDGLQNDLYKALVVADKLNLLDVTSNGASRWDEPLSKVEAIQLFINIGSAKNNLYGYASTGALGKENPDKYGKVAFDSEESKEQAEQVTELAPPGMNAANPDGAPGASGNSPWITGPDGIPVKNPYYDPELPTTIPEDPAAPADSVVPPANEVVPPAVVTPPAPVVPPAGKPSAPQSQPGTKPQAPESNDGWGDFDALTGGSLVDGSGTITNPDDEGLIRPN